MHALSKSKIIQTLSKTSFINYDFILASYEYVRLQQLLKLITDHEDV